MGQYIEIATPNKTEYKKNIAIISVLEFLGKKYKVNRKNVRIQKLSDYKAGLVFINNKCGKRYKTAIKHLIFSQKKVTMFHAEYRNWKFHKQKVEKFLTILHRELKKMNAPKEIWLLFNTIYLEVSLSFPIERKGSHVIFYPYHAELYQFIDNDQCQTKEKEVIRKIVEILPEYNLFYYEVQHE